MEEKAMQNDEVLDIYEMSRYLRCSVDTIRRMVQRKHLPHYRVGNRIFTRKSFLDEWILNQVTCSVENNAYAE
ncbi:helix-turn-helix domain-containing protein [Paenibacillus sp. GCM10012307]